MNDQQFDTISKSMKRGNSRHLYAVPYVIKLFVSMSDAPLYAADTSSFSYTINFVVRLKYNVTIFVTGTLQKKVDRVANLVRFKIYTWRL